MQKKQKVVIVGGGISGLSAGIYALDNGYEVHIYEKHTIAGGQCTGWDRNGMYIDGCAHWIVGTNPESDLFPLWKHVGAFDETSHIFPTEYFCKFDLGDGRIFTAWADLNRLKDEMLRFGPQDRWQIERFLSGIRAYRHVSIPARKPLDLMNPWEYLKFGISFVPLALHYLLYKWQSSARYARRFRSPELSEVFRRIIDGRYCVHSLFYIMQALSRGDAGMVAGGSRAMAQRIKERFVERGGHIHLGQEVERIIVEDNTARGIVLKKTGERVDADYVIATSDMHHTLYHLLEGKIHDKSFEEKVQNRNDNPLICGVLAAFKASSPAFPRGEGASDGDASAAPSPWEESGVRLLPKMISIPLRKPFMIGETEMKYITVRNHAFDTELYPKDVTLTVLIDVREDLFDTLSAMTREEYLAYKKELGERLRREIAAYFGFADDQLSLLDVATPLTHRRYANAWRGSYMSFLTTTRSRELMRKGVIKGLKNFYLAGQWLMSPGGLPIALFTGKHAIYRLQNDNGRKFIDLDER